MNEIVEVFLDYEKRKKEKKKLYYFAHPYTKYEDKGYVVTEASNIQMCIDTVNILIDAGYNIYAPILITSQLHQYKKRDYDFWIEFDKIFMDRCDGIILAYLWELSKGCKIEKEFFEKQNKEILYARDLI